jgi:hypothetical protein
MREKEARMSTFDQYAPSVVFFITAGALGVVMHLNINRKQREIARVVGLLAIVLLCMSIVLFGIGTFLK